MLDYVMILLPTEDCLNDRNACNCGRNIFPYSVRISGERVSGSGLAVMFPVGRSILFF